MPLYRAFLQTLGATVLLALALACHGKGGSGSATTATISGTVTYQRVPLVKDGNGVPTGLADATIPANLVTLPAQGVRVRIFQQVPQTQTDGTIKSLWTLIQTSSTDVNGAYSATATLGRSTMVELSSTFSGGGSQIVQLIAEPQGINSTTPVLDRLQYAMRKAIDGSAQPPGINAPSAVLAGNATVNFSVGLNDAWWIVNPTIDESSGEATHVTEAVLETSLSGLSTGTGSRVMGIGDTIASFVTNYGTATPGGTLDLHYWPGLDSGGSYVVYDRSQFAVAQASSTYFGTLRGGPANDDAWDEGVILTLLARNVLYGSNLTRTFGVALNPIFPPGAPLVDLSPEVARIEGLAQTMAANVLKSPYLADTNSTGLTVVDVRNISGLTPSQLSLYSAPAIRAFAWEVILKANSLPTPGLPSDWAKINPLAGARYFLAPLSLTYTAPSGSVYDAEPLNIYNQMLRLKEAQTSTEPINLAAIFTDPVLTGLAAPFNITWPRPVTGASASFVADWGTDPAGALPPVPLSMAKAVQVGGTYPNVSEGEIFYAGFNLSADRRCTLTASIAPALASGVKVDVDLPVMLRTFTFMGDGSGQNTAPIVIPVNGAVPYFHPVRIHLRSQSVLQPDVTVTLTLTPLP